MSQTPLLSTQSLAQLSQIAPESPPTALAVPAVQEPTEPPQAPLTTGTQLPPVQVPVAHCVPLQVPLHPSEKDVPQAVVEAAEQSGVQLAVGAEQEALEPPPVPSQVQVQPGPPVLALPGPIPALQRVGPAGASNDGTPLAEPQAPSTTGTQTPAVQVPDAHFVPVPQPVPQLSA
jgi:hypothetical protein